MSVATLVRPDALLRLTLSVQQQGDETSKTSLCFLPNYPKWHPQALCTVEELVSQLRRGSQNRFTT